MSREENHGQGVYGRHAVDGHGLGRYVVLVGSTYANALSAFGTAGLDF